MSRRQWSNQFARQSSANLLKHKDFIPLKTQNQPSQFSKTQQTDSDNDKNVNVKNKYKTLFNQVFNDRTNSTSDFKNGYQTWKNHQTDNFKRPYEKSNFKDNEKYMNKHERYTYKDSDIAREMRLRQLRNQYTYDDYWRQNNLTKYKQKGHLQTLKQLQDNQTPFSKTSISDNVYRYRPRKTANQQSDDHNYNNRANSVDKNVNYQRYERNPFDIIEKSPYIKKKCKKQNSHSNCVYCKNNISNRTIHVQQLTKQQRQNPIVDIEKGDISLKKIIDNYNNKARPSSLQHAHIIKNITPQQAINLIPQKSNLSSKNIVDNNQNNVQPNAQSIKKIIVQPEHYNQHIVQPNYQRISQNIVQPQYHKHGQPITQNIGQAIVQAQPQPHHIQRNLQKIGPAIIHPQHYNRPNIQQNLQNIGPSIVQHPNYNQHNIPLHVQNIGPSVVQHPHHQNIDPSVIPPHYIQHSIPSNIQNIDPSVIQSPHYIQNNLQPHVQNIDPSVVQHPHYILNNLQPQVQNIGPSNVHQNPFIHAISQPQFYNQQFVQYPQYNMQPYQQNYQPQFNPNFYQFLPMQYLQMMPQQQYMFQQQQNQFPQNVSNNTDKQQKNATNDPQQLVDKMTKQQKTNATNVQQNGDQANFDFFGSLIGHIVKSVLPQSQHEDRPLPQHQQMTTPKIQLKKSKLTRMNSSKY